MLFDYVNTYKNEPLSEANINYLDLLVFAELSNFNWQDKALGLPLCEAIYYSAYPLFYHRNRKTQKQRKVQHRDVPNEGGAIALYYLEDMKLAEVVANSPRYRDVFVLAFDEDFIFGSKQFAGLSLMLNDLVIVCFRGTDETATGWNESLSLSLQTPVPAQRDAAAFLETIMSQTNGPVIACGHSKGGNLAVYASAQIAEHHPQEATRIAAIANFDGPGMPQSVRSQAGYNYIGNLINVFIPKSSVVGNVHTHPAGSVMYIESKMPFVVQHYVHHWKTKDAHFLQTKQTLAGRIGSAGLSVLVNYINDAGKKIIIGTIFLIPKLIELLVLKMRGSA